MHAPPHTHTGLYQQQLQSNWAHLLPEKGIAYRNMKKKIWRKKLNSLFETLNLLNILYQLKQKQIPKIKNK